MPFLFHFVVRLMLDVIQLLALLFMRLASEVPMLDLECLPLQYIDIEFVFPELHMLNSQILFKLTMPLLFGPSFQNALCIYSWVFDS